MSSASCTPGVVTVSRVTRDERSETVSCVVCAVGGDVLVWVLELVWFFFFFCPRFFFFALWGPGMWEGERKFGGGNYRRVLSERVPRHASHEIEIFGSCLLRAIISNYDSATRCRPNSFAQCGRLICICYPLHLAQYTLFGAACSALRAIVK